jgi:hypothetical protein
MVAPPRADKNLSPSNTNKIAAQPRVDKNLSPSNTNKIAAQPRVDKNLSPSFSAGDCEQEPRPATVTQDETPKVTRDGVRRRTFASSKKAWRRVDQLKATCDTPSRGFRSKTFCIFGLSW